MNNFNNNCCKHKIGVQVYSWNSSYKWNEVYCLDCKENFNGPNTMFSMNFYELLPFENIIHFENLNEISNNEKLSLATIILEELKIKYPDLSVTDIVKNINNQMTDNKTLVKMKSKGR